MNLLTRFVILCITSGFFLTQAHSQDLENLLERYAGDDAEGYVQPFSDALGSNMNSGWYHSSFVRKKGFQLYFGIISQSALIPDKKTTYEASLPDFFTPQSPTTSVTVPTIMGDAQNVIVPGANGTEYAFPGGLGVTMVPLAVPQLTIGSLYGTDVSLRFVPIDLGGDVGDLSLFGWGVRHSISQYFSSFPVELAVAYYSTDFELGDELETSHQLISIQGSYFVGKKNMLELYGGLGIESGSFNFTYFSESEGVDIELDLEPSNSVRFTIGATLNLGVFTLNADYNLADQQAISAGIGVGFGKKKNSE